MPGTTKKALYIAKNLTELNTKTGDTIKVREGQCRMYAKSSEKVFKNAEESDLLGDEERAYVLYMKFLNILTGIRKTAEYKKNKKFYDDLIGLTKMTTALSNAETLSKSLQERYEEKEAEEVSAKFERLDRGKEAEKELDDKLDDEPQENGQKVEETVTEPSRDEILEKKGFICCEKMYTLIYDDSTSFVIMDIRPAEQFETSHINYKKCINIPKEIIHAGCTVRHLEGNIPSSSKEGWNQRGNVDFIILLDWTCTDKDMETGAALCSLKDAIYKWDQETVIKSQPLLLEGGYEEWLNMYPTLTTNAMVPRPPSYSSVANNTLTLDKIDYDLDLNFLKTPEQLAAEEKAKNMRNNMMSGGNQAIVPPSVGGRNNMPVIPDRKSKPNNMVIPTNARHSENLNRIKNDFSEIKGMSLSEMRKKLENDDMTVPVKNINIVNEIKRDQDNTGTKVEVKKPVPTVDRNLKPKPVVNSVNDNRESTTDISVVKEETMVNSNKTDDIVKGEIPKSVVEDTKVTQKLNEGQAEVDELHRQQESKQAEFESYKTENKRLILETEARRAKLNKEKEQFEKINTMKSKAKEEHDEMEKKIEAMRLELEQMEVKKSERFAEEKRRQDEIEKIQREEGEKKAKLKRETERLRQERKKKEEVEKAENERLALEEKRKQQELLKQQAMEEQKRKEMEEKLAQEAQIKQAQAREAKEAQARIEKEKKEREEQERRQREETERKTAETSARAPLHPMLPVGWERRMDPTSNKYYYLNHHTKKTQWEMPTVSSKSTSQTKAGVYKAKLKTEDDLGGGGGLKRSHSSPNIAKMMQDEEERKSQPGVNRTAKPQQPVSRGLELQTHRLSEAKVRNFNPIWGSVSHGLTGLRNQGNTCYMNSTLQCLSNTGFLTTYVLSGNYRHDINVHNKMGTQGEVAEEYAALVKNMWSGQYKSITPRDFKLICARYNSKFAGYDQQDSQELLLCLLDWMHEDLNKIHQRRVLPEQKNDDIPLELAGERAWEMHKSINDSIIVQLFEGQYKSTVTCKVCDKRSVTFQTFRFLLLEIPSQTRCNLRDCLLTHSKIEKMDVKWACPNCKMKREATRQLVIWKLPPILLIVLKRFDDTGMWRKKNSAHVDFPVDNVDFNNFVSGPKHSKPYSLYAMSNHVGTLEGGHYTAQCKNPKLDRWFKFDDHEVYECSMSNIKNAGAYFLCYSCIKEGN